MAVLQAALRKGRGGDGPPTGDRGCVLLFTTRSSVMVTDSDPATLHMEMHPLSDAHALQVLAAAVAGRAAAIGGEGHPPPWTPQKRKTAAAIVAFADDHPLTLCVAGALARKYGARGGGGGLAKALRRLRARLEAVNGHLGATYGRCYSSLWASLQASYDSLPLQMRAPYKQLAVLRTKSRLPPVAMAALWGVDAVTAVSIAEAFVDASMATLWEGTAVGQAPAGGESLALHDIQLHFVREMCAADPGGVADAHESLLWGYAQAYGLVPTTERVLPDGPPVDLYPWWEVPRADPYIRDELCRCLHGAGAGRLSELRLLLHTWAYVSARVGLCQTGASLPSTALYRGDCEFDELAADVAAVVEGAVLRGDATTLVAFEVVSRLQVVADGDADDERRALLGSLLAGVRCSISGAALWCVAPQTALTPPLELRTFSYEGEGACPYALPRHSRVLTCMAALPQLRPEVVDGDACPQRIVAGGSDGCLRVFDVSTGRATSVLRGHTGYVKCVTAVAGGASDGVSTAVVSGSTDGSLCVWTVDPPAVVHNLIGHREPVLCVAAVDGCAGADARSAGQPMGVVSGVRGGQLRIWDIREGTCVAVLDIEVRPAIVNCVAVVGWAMGGGAHGGGTTGRRVIICATAGPLLVWSETGGKWAQEWETAFPGEIGFSGVELLVPLGTAPGGADGAQGAGGGDFADRVAVVSRGNDMAVYDVATGRHVATLKQIFRLLPTSAAVVWGAPAAPALLACADWRGDLTMCDVFTPSYPTFSVGSHASKVTCVVALHRPRFIAGQNGGPGTVARQPVLVTGAADGTISLWGAAVLGAGRGQAATAAGAAVSCLKTWPAATRADLPSDDAVSCSLGDAGGDGRGGGDGPTLCLGWTDGSVSVRRWAQAADTVVLPPLGKPLRFLVVAHVRAPVDNEPPQPHVLALSDAGVRIWSAAKSEAAGAAVDALTALASLVGFMRVIPTGGTPGRPSSFLAASLSSTGAGMVRDVRIRRPVLEIRSPLQLAPRFLLMMDATGSGDGSCGACLPPLVVCAATKGRIVVWEAQTGRHLRTFTVAPRYFLFSIAAVPSAGAAVVGGRRLVAVIDTGPATSVWDVDTGMRL